MYMIFVFFTPDSTLALQKSQNNCIAISGNTIIFLFDLLLASDINFIIQQTSVVAQEPPIILQDAFPDSGISALLPTSSSTPTADEVLRQVRYFFQLSRNPKSTI